jgi:hypothetical protein
MSNFTRKTVLICTLFLLAGPIQIAPAEPNTVEIDVFENVVCEQELVTPMGPEFIRMTGRATVHVIFEGLREGLADDDDGNHLDEVDTEIVELSLTGLSPSLGPLKMRLSTGIQSIGMMEETANDRTGLLEVPPFGPGSVDSFFDIYFELDVAGQTFYGQGPMRLGGLLSEKPAGHTDTYGNQQPIQLLDANGDPTPLSVGPGRMRPNPPVELDLYETALCWLDLQIPDGSIIKITLTGQTTERIFFEGADQGSAFDDDGNRLDEVHTEMPVLDMKGNNPYLGPLYLRLNSDLLSLGLMEEQGGHNTGVLDVPPFTKDGYVDSFFDVFFELDLSIGTFHNQSPMCLRGVLWHKPAGPMTIYEISTPIQLYDEDGNPSGLYINACRYRPSPVVEIDEMDTSTGIVDLVSPSGGSYTVELIGTSKMHTFFERDFEGSANDDDGNGLDEVKTELVELSLSGFDPELGQVHLGLDQSTPTMGQIEERTNILTGMLDLSPFDEGGYADSFFDVYAEIEVGGTLMYVARPMFWRGVLNKKPAAPGDTYENLEAVKLVDAHGTETGWTLGAVRYVPTACGDSLHPYPIGDLNLDCQVNFLDVAIMGLHWLECTRPDCY